jgi:GT2 family glycosyltransferase
LTALSVLFVNYNSWRLCAAAVRSLLEAPPRAADGSLLPFEVLVVDNCSPQRDPDAEAELEVLVQRGGGRLLRHGNNGGYAQGMNLAYRNSRGELVLVSNPDVSFAPGCVDALVAALARDKAIGAAAPQGFWDHGHECMLPPNILPTLGDLLRLTLAALSRRWVQRYARRRTRAALAVWSALRDVELEMLSGCCFLMRRELIERLGPPGHGPFDERFPLYYEDTDLSVRIRQAGARIVQVHAARLVQLNNRSGQTVQDLAMQRYWISRQRYYRKWYGPLGGALHRCSRWLLATAWGRRRGARTPYATIHDLGASLGRPTLVLDRPRRRFLVEIALDPNFYLAAGVFASGASWTPGDRLFENFGPTTFYFRVVDLDAASLPLIGVWRYTRLYPQPSAELCAQEGAR